MKRPDSPVVIDADLSEWNFAFWVDMNKLTEPDNGRTEANFPTDGTDADLSGQEALMWDDDNLYFAAVVKDDTAGAAGSAWFGDGIEIYLSSVNIGAGTLHGDRANGAAFLDEANGDYEVHLFIRYDADADTTALIGFMPANLGLVKSSDVVIEGELNADQDGYFLEGRIAWSALASPTTGNTFNFNGGERVAAQFSLIDIDIDESSVRYAAIQLLKNRGFGPNGNPGGRVWNTLDVLGISFVQNNIITDVEDGGEPQIVERFILEQNYPNPFNPSTQIKFSLDEPGVVSLKIYNVAGQLIQTVIHETRLQAGEHALNVEMAGRPSGVYFYTLQSGDRMIAKKMTLLK